jgi:anti-sigma regulatory factor (Ser/Thr protein kinase)
VETNAADSVTLPPSPESVAVARSFMADRVTGARANDACLVVSELVTNALVHSRGAVRLTTRRTRGDINIEVWDSDLSLLPATKQAQADQPGGRGLRIVEDLCDTWGYRPDPPGKTVWCTMRVEPADWSLARRTA